MILDLHGEQACARLMPAMEPDSPHLRGCLVVFEGIDGTGKSTQIKLLAEYLRERGKEVVTDFEPTRGEWGMKVRHAALSGERLGIEEEINCLLQDRREHVREFIEPALERGAWVLLDRYYLSMMAYQGASGVNVEDIREMNEEFATIPDVAFWLDIPVETAMERMNARGNGKDAFENEPFLQACAAIYSAMEMPWFFRIEADGSIEETQAAIQQVIRTELGV
ncbi:MAG: dTMP kinase [Akkermansia sp.]|nr:dTMP kinase [Akkermansia sp.]